MPDRHCRSDVDGLPALATLMMKALVALFEVSNTQGCDGWPVLLWDEQSGKDVLRVPSSALYCVV